MKVLEAFAFLPPRNVTRHGGGLARHRFNTSEGTTHRFNISEGTTHRFNISEGIIPGFNILEGRKYHNIET